MGADQTQESLFFCLFWRTCTRIVDFLKIKRSFSYYKELHSAMSRGDV